MVRRTPTSEARYLSAKHFTEHSGTQEQCMMYRQAISTQCKRVNCCKVTLTYRDPAGHFCGVMRSARRTASHAASRCTVQMNWQVVSLVLQSNKWHRTTFCKRNKWKESVFRFHHIRSIGACLEWVGCRQSSIWLSVANGVKPTAPRTVTPPGQVGVVAAANGVNPTLDGHRLPFLRRRRNGMPFDRQRDAARRADPS